jgi:polyhydroxybutyrate depolymerase
MRSRLARALDRQPPSSVVALCACLAALVASCTSIAPTGAPSVGTPTATGTGTPVGTRAPSATPSAGSAHVGLEDVCASTGDVVIDATIEGAARSVLVHRPATAVTGTAASRLPLVIVLHGNGGSAAGMPIMTGMSLAADASGFIAVYPQGVDREWGIVTTGDQFKRDRALLDAIVDAFTAGGCASADRVVVAGFSLGGIFAHGLACTDAQRFHALVEVSSRSAAEYVRDGPQVPQSCTPGRPVTFVAYNATEDDVIPYEAGHLFGWQFPGVDDWVAEWAARNACAGGPDTTASNARVDRLDWTGCAAATVLYRIKGGRHAWFGGDPPIGGLALEDTDPVETVERLVRGEAP